MRKLATFLVSIALVAGLAPVAQAHSAPWKPSDECARVDTRRIAGPLRNRSVWQTMRWCPMVAYYLDLGERRGVWVWNPGDLTKILAIMSCESGGLYNGTGESFNGFEPNNVWGLFQFRVRYWPERGARAARHLGFSNPNLRMPYDQIATGVDVYKIEGTWPWETCGKW